MKALIIDDAIVDRTACIRILMSIKNETLFIEAKDGMDALELYDKHQPFDYITIDIKMPIINGLDVLSIIRDNNKEVPIIVVSSDETCETKSKAYSLGATKYITKPINKDKLITAIEDALSQNSH